MRSFSSIACSLPSVARSISSMSLLTRDRLVDEGGSSSCELVACDLFLDWAAGMVELAEAATTVESACVDVVYESPLVVAGQGSKFLYSSNDQAGKKPS